MKYTGTDLDNNICLIETMLWTKDRAADQEMGFYLLNRHLCRLESSAQFFKIDLKKREIVKRLRQLSDTLKNMEHDRFRVRLLVSSDGTFTLSNEPLSNLSKERVSFDISPLRVRSDDPFLYHKTTRRELFERERQRISPMGIFETVFLNEYGELTQGTITNIFLDMGETRLLTPSLSCGLLPGTLRQELIENGSAIEAVLFPSHLEKARKIFLGNSLRGLLEARLI